MILPASMWIGPLMLDKKKRQRKSAPAFQVHTDLKAELCEIIQGGVGEWGQGTGKPQQAILLSDVHIFYDCNTRKRLQSHQQRWDWNEKQFKKSLTSTVSHSLCTIVCLWSVSAWTGAGPLRTPLDCPQVWGWFFQRLAFVWRGKFHPVCTADTSLIN